MIGLQNALSAGKVLNLEYGHRNVGQQYVVACGVNLRKLFVGEGATSVDMVDYGEGFALSPPSVGSGKRCELPFWELASSITGLGSAPERGVAVAKNAF